MLIAANRLENSLRPIRYAAYPESLNELFVSGIPALMELLLSALFLKMRRPQENSMSIP